jgi:hypothetical protein
MTDFTKEAEEIWKKYYDISREISDAIQAGKRDEMRSKYPDGSTHGIIANLTAAALQAAHDEGYRKGLEAAMEVATQTELCPEHRDNCTCYETAMAAIESLLASNDNKN